MGILSVVVGWGVLVLITTEVLSGSGVLEFHGVIAAWTIVALSWAFVGYRRETIPSGRKRTVEPLTVTASAYLAVIVAILGITFALAIVSAPTAGDAQSYHMARVAHWIQNRSVNFYPTNIDRQLWSNPWAEYVILQLQLLSGGDRLANLVQWTAFAGSIGVVTRIAANLGCKREAQLFAGLFAATIPMAIAQSAGAQTDLVASFWLLVFVLATLEYPSAAQGHFPISGAILGASLGLAILTKGTNYLYTLPFLAWWLAREHVGRTRTNGWTFALMAATALAINSPHYYRNLKLYNWPLGPSGSEGLMNGTFGPRVVLSNLVRNAALHLGTPEDTRLPMSVQFNASATRGVVALHRWIGMDVNDPRTTWRNYKFRVPFQTRSELDTGNPIHAVLILFSFGLILFRARRTADRATRYAFCLACQILLFCLVLRWQPFNSRLQLTAFLAAAPLVAYCLQLVTRQAVAVFIATFLAFRAVPSLVKNPARPLVGTGAIQRLTREERFFTEEPQIEAPYTGAAEFIAKSGCRDIALKTGWSEWEYAFWAVAKPRLGQFRLTHTGIMNLSASLTDPAPAGGRAPCALLTLNENRPAEKVPPHAGFVVAWRLDNVTVELPTSAEN